MSTGFVAEVAPNENLYVAPANAVYNSLTKGTIAFWLYLFSLPTGTSTSALIVKDALNAAYPTNLILFQSGGSVFLEGAIVDSLGNKGTSDSSTPMNTGAWVHILMTYDFTGDKVPHLYLNGVQTPYSAQTPVITSAPFDDSGGGWYIGNDTFDDGLAGLMAEVAIWNTVLSGAQITAVATATNGIGAIASANLVGYWHFIGDTVNAPDTSGNGNTAISNKTLATGVYRSVDSPGFTSTAVSAPTLSVTASDNFHRANEQPLNPTNWAKGSFDLPLAVVGNICVVGLPALNGAEWWIGTASPNDQFASVTAGAAGVEMDVLIRSSSDYATGYDWTYSPSAVGAMTLGFLSLANVAASRIAPLYILPNEIQVGDILTLAAVGTSIYTIRNGVVLSKSTDGGVASGLPGLFIASSVQGDTSVSFFQTGGASAPSGSFKHPAASIETRQFTTTRPFPGFGPIIH